MESDYAIRASHHIKRALFVLCRYPAFSTEFIRKNIETSVTDPQEIRDYKNNWAKAKRWRASILVSIYLYTIIRNSCMLHLWLEAYKFSADIGSNALDHDQEGLSGKPGALERVSCVLTNCTHLGPLDYRYGNPFAPNSRARLIEDISRLPLYVICNADFDRAHYTPVTRLDAFGTLALAVTIYTQFLLGFWIILQQSLMPSGDDIIMFITSPKVSAEIYRRRIKSIVEDMAASFATIQCQACPTAASSLSTDTKKSLTPDAAGLVRITEWYMYLRQFHPSRGQLERCVGEKSTCLGRCSSEKLSRCSSDCAVATKYVDQTQSADYCGGNFCCSSASKQQRLDRAARNCLPIIRGQWWRRLQARLMLRIAVLGVSGIFNIGTLAFYLVSRRLKAKRRLLDQFELEMERSNCFLWPHTATLLEPEQAVQLDQVSVHWTLRSFLNATVLSFLAGCSITLMFAYYWSSVISLGVWLAEMRMFMVASLIATRFQHQRERAQQERELTQDEATEVEADLEGADFSSPMGGRDREDYSKLIGRDYFISTREFFNLANLRLQFKDTTHLFHFTAVRRIERRDKWTYNAARDTADGRRGATSSKPHYDWHRLNAKSSDRHHADRFLAEIMFPCAGGGHERSERQLAPAKFDRTDYDPETLEQIYVNFRLLVDYVQKLGAGMRVAVAITYLLNYGLVFLAVLFRNRFPKLHIETGFLIIFALLIANYLIFMAADVHANARQLHPLIWSLIAQLTYSKEAQVRHLRSLWLKQLLVLEHEGGMAMSCGSLRITYVYIIQLMIWTATIVGIALKPAAR